MGWGDWGDVVKRAQSSEKTEISFGVNKEGMVEAGSDMVTVLLALQQRGGTGCWCHSGQEGVGSCSVTSCPGMGSFLRLVHGQLGSCTMAGGIVAGAVGTPP